MPRDRAWLETLVAQVVEQNRGARRDAESQRLIDAATAAARAEGETTLAGCLILVHACRSAEVEGLALEALYAVLEQATRARAAAGRAMGGSPGRDQ